MWCGFDRLSHRVWKLFLCSATKYENYFYALLFYFLNAKVFIIELLFKWAKLAKFIRYEALWELLFKQTFFYHKVHGEQVKWWRFWGLWGTSEMFWKGHEFSVGRCRKTFSLMKRFFTTLRFVQNDMVLFLLTIRNLFQWKNYFWNAKVFYYSYVFKEAKWEFASELMKRVF